jgi:putative exosortase-associated protein (TIGR04073 family)
MDTATGWMELPQQVIKGYREGYNRDRDRKIMGVLYGVPKGLWYATGRTVSGMLEIFTCLTLNPEHNEGVGIPLDSDYAWEEGIPYDFHDPNFADATIVPMGNKLKRGLANLLFGFMEIPAQVANGLQERAVDLGILRGLWFWMSREVSGAADIITVLLPGQEEQKGMAFEEEWPWESISANIR